MDRPVQIGDKVRVSLGNQSTIYQIVKIEGTHIYISDGNRTSLIYLNGDGKWVIYQGEHIDYIIEFLPSESSEFGSNLHITFRILARLDYSDLLTACELNEYTKEICEHEDFWYLKIQHDFGGEVAWSKPEELTYKGFFSYLISNIDNPNIYVESKILSMVKWLFDRGIVPDWDYKLKLLEFIDLDWLNEIYDQMYSVRGPNYHPRGLPTVGPGPSTNLDVSRVAAAYGRIDILEWLLATNRYAVVFDLTSPYRDIHDDTLKWLVEHGEWIRQEDVNNIFGRGSEEIISWLMNKPENYQPNPGAFHSALDAGNINNLNRLVEMGILLPDDPFYFALRNGNMVSVKWLIEHNVQPGEDNINKSERYPEIFNYLWNLGYRPTNSNIAVATGNEELILWLRDQEIFPEEWAGEIALDQGDLNMLKLLYNEFGILPRRSSFSQASKYPEIRVWLEEHNVPIESFWGTPLITIPRRQNQ